MSKRGENIYKRKDGRWEGRYKTVKPNGQVKYASVYAKSYTAVKEKLQSRKRDIANYNHNLPECQLTVENILQLWLENHKDNIKLSSYLRYKRLIDQHLLPGLGSLPLRELTAKKLSSFLKQKKQAGRLDKKGGLAAKTISDMLAIIKSAVKMALSDYSISNGAGLLEVKAPTFKQRQIETFSDYELQILTNYLLQDFTPSNAAILLCLNTGLRLGEVCALRWADIDFKAQTLSVRQSVQRVTQNGKSILLFQTPKSETSKRTIPLTAEILLMLKSLQKANSKEYVFGGSCPLEPRTMQYRFASLLKKCGITRRNFHVLRHTFASRYVAAGADVKSLSEILGHSNVRITMQLYVHPTLAQKRNYLENICTLNPPVGNCA